MEKMNREIKRTLKTIDEFERDEDKHIFNMCVFLFTQNILILKELKYIRWTILEMACIMLMLVWRC